MTAINSPTPAQLPHFSMWGFHTKKTILSNFDPHISYPVKPMFQNNLALDAFVTNTLSGTGYLPALGIVAGYLRIKLIIGNSRMHVMDKIANVVRGVFEILGAGIVFLVPDIALTVYRCVTCDSKMEEAYKKWREMNSPQRDSDGDEELSVSERMK